MLKVNSKLTPEERVTRARNAVNTRWARDRISRQVKVLASRASLFGRAYLVEIDDHWFTAFTTDGSVGPVTLERIEDEYWHPIHHHLQPEVAQAILDAIENVSTS